jgi:hypothetical protein
VHYIERRHGIPVVSASTSVSTAVLQPSDFTFLGSMTLPLDTGSERYGFSTGAMTGRVIGGNIHLYITGANWETGWNDPVYEVLYTGVGTRGTFVFNWGDITLTAQHRPTANGANRDLRGILWDETSGQMLWSYMDSFSSNWDPCFGTSILSGGTVTPFGPWRPGSTSQHCGGYMYELPARAQAALGGKRIASGAPYSSIDIGSTFGTYAAAWTPPANGTTPDTAFDGTHITIPTTDLLYSDISHPQPRINDTDYCGWTHYGESDGFGDQPQLNPTQDGTGCTPHGNLCGAPFGTPTFGPGSNWFPGDQVGAAVWIEGTQKQGVLYIGQIARTLAANASEYGTYGKCHVWYGPGQQAVTGFHLCSHGQVDSRYAQGTGNSMTTAMSTMWIYDPASLLAVAGGSSSPIGVVPNTDGYDMSLLPHSGSVFPQLATSWNYPWGSQYGAAWFEPVSKQLFVSQMHAELQGVEYRPVIHVFSVNC